MLQRRNIIFLLVLIFISFLFSFFLLQKQENEGKKITPLFSSLVRPAFFAGSFYPREKEKLVDKLEGFFSAISPREKKEKLRILLVPHAGFDYSGQVAAFGFREIQGKNYQKVILLGVAHQNFFSHIAVFPKGAWETPLGKVEVEEDLAQFLADKEKAIILDSSVHKNEHSLEVEIPFLQKTLSQFKILPILIGQVEEESLFSLAEKIAAVFDEETLLVVSSDLAHYPSATVARKVDPKLLEAFLSGKKEKFSQTLQEIESAGFPNLSTAACGASALKVALLVAEKLKLTDFQLLKYANSGEITGETDRVVGYGVVGVWGKLSEENYLDKEAQKAALKLARETLEAFVGRKPLSTLSPLFPSLEQKLGAFVTLRKKGQLRGCIGVFEPLVPLSQVIAEMTVAAASRDERFPPVRPEELSEIKIEISLLSPKKKIENFQEIILGKHGVVVEKGKQSGTFLPQVAEETGWDRETFLKELCQQKAGLPPSCYQDKSVNLYVFTAQVFSEEDF